MTATPRHAMIIAREGKEPTMTHKPYITRATGGEYSTVQVGDYIETCWFGNDGSSRVIARTLIATIAREHIEAEAVQS